MEFVILNPISIYARLVWSTHLNTTSQKVKFSLSELCNPTSLLNHLILSWSSNLKGSLDDFTNMLSNSTLVNSHGIDFTDNTNGIQPYVGDLSLPSAIWRWASLMNLRDNIVQSPCSPKEVMMNTLIVGHFEIPSIYVGLKASLNARGRTFLLYIIV